MKSMIAMQSSFSKALQTRSHKMKVSHGNKIPKRVFSNNGLTNGNKTIRLLALN